MDNLTMEAINIFAPVAVTVLTGLVSWGTFEITKFFRTKTKNDTVNDAIAHICNTTETVVTGLNQTIVKGLKLASKDGKLSKEEMTQLKKLAATQISYQIPTAMQKTSEIALSSFQDFISSKIEQTVFDKKIK